MLNLIHKILALLSPRERRQAYLLFGMILVMAFLDVVGIASVMPFMAVLANPEVVHTNARLNAVYAALGFTEPERFLFFLGLVVFAALVVCVAFKAVTMWAITHFTQMRNYTIARRLVAGYLRQPYDWFLNRHSAEIGKTVLSEVELVVKGALVPLMRLVSQGVVAIAILILLIAVDPKVALVVGGGMAGTYLAIYLALRRFLSTIGRRRLEANKLRFKAVSEAFGGIKEAKLAGQENAAIRRFDTPARRFARTQVTQQVLGMMPRYALEVVAFGGMLLLALFLMRSANGLGAALPMIALYAFVSNRGQTLPFASSTRWRANCRVA